jgi:hypothetical protein
MNKEINDGGPAFPCIPPTLTPDQYAYFPSGMGMTLRDWFAGQALAGWWASHAHEEAGSPICESVYLYNAGAEYCYLMADAMLKARNGDE